MDKIEGYFKQKADIKKNTNLKDFEMVQEYFYRLDDDIKESLYFANK